MLHRFEVRVNGSLACLAGIDGYGVLSVVIHAVDRNSPGAASHEEVNLNVGGLKLQTADPMQGQHIDWVSLPLRVGDEITVRVMDEGKASPPLSVKVPNR